jgi:hypothetical protein
MKNTKRKATSPAHPIARAPRAASRSRAAIPDFTRAAWLINECLRQFLKARG